MRYALQLWQNIRIATIVSLSWIVIISGAPLVINEVSANAIVPGAGEYIGGVNPGTPPEDVPSEGRNTGTMAWAWALQRLTELILSLAAVIALVFLLYSALKLTYAGDNEETMEQGKNGVVYGLGGLVLLLMITPLVRNVFYRGGDGRSFEDPAAIAETARQGTDLLLGALNWVEAIVVIVAVGFIIFAGLRMITALGDSDQISKARGSILYVGLGIVIILFYEIIVQILYTYIIGDDLVVAYEPDAETGVFQLIQAINYFLQFVGVVAFLSFVYGGGLMITAFGSDDQIEKGKKILTGSIIGIVLILTSYVLVELFINAEV
jgi:hypothetical protein